MLHTVPACHDASALMPAVARGDVAAFRAVAGAVQGPLLRIAERTLGDRAAAEDVVQVTLTRLWTQATRFDPARGSVLTWARRIAVNLCLDRRRALRPVADIADHPDLADTAPDPETALIATDQQARLMLALARLAPRQRLAITLFHHEGLSMAEIAEALETTPKAVEGLLGRARMELKAMLMETTS